MKRRNYQIVGTLNLSAREFAELTKQYEVEFAAGRLALLSLETADQK